MKPLVEENLFELSLANIVENYALYLNSRRSGKKLKDVTKTQRIRRLRRIVNLCESKKLKQLLDDEYQRKKLCGTTLLIFAFYSPTLKSILPLILAQKPFYGRHISNGQSFTSDLIEDRLRSKRQTLTILKMETSLLWLIVTKALFYLSHSSDVGGLSRVQSH